MNMAPTIIPRSDQLNADDLISGPITVKITAVIAGSKEQPVSVAIEGFEGRPYKPSKSMRRVLVTLWGNDAGAYIGRRLTLYRDATVRFGPDMVGGIKISHASDISGPQEIILTERRGCRKPFRVLALGDEYKAPPVDLGELPEAWAQWTNEERGDYMANQGAPRLEAWWKSLTVAVRKALENRLANWKDTARAKVEAMQTRGGRT